MGYSCFCKPGRHHSRDKKAEDYIKDVLGIPEKYSVESIIAIGYPAGEKKPHDENGLLYGKLHYNRY
jgi:nitroreductase